jgi:predicted CopG family antitoxin
MTNILLDVYPQLTEWRTELSEVSEVCETYTDEQNFTKDEKKAITRLCKLSIMWIHADNNKPLEEFLVNDKSTNDEFSKVINRSLKTYTEKDFSVVKDALKKLEWDEENVVFGTVYDVFMGIKNIFN